MYTFNIFVVSIFFTYNLKLHFFFANNNHVYFYQRDFMCHLVSLNRKEYLKCNIIIKENIFFECFKY